MMILCSGRDSARALCDEGTMRRKLGELLVERGFIEPRDLEDALDLQRRSGVRLGVALLQLDRVDEANLVSALGELFNVPAVSLSGFEADPEAVKTMSARFASEHDVFPLRIRTDRGRRVLTVAMVDPSDYRTIDELGFMTNARIEVVIASPSDVDRALRMEFGTRFGATPTAGSPRLDLKAGRHDDEMTILRRGGGEETIRTGAQTPGHGEPQTNSRTPREQAPTRRPEIVTGSLTSNLSDAISGPTGGLGALIARNGQTVDADMVLRMDKRFWALMRVLARKGVISKEDFLRELGDDVSWREGS